MKTQHFLKYLAVAYCLFFLSCNTSTTSHNGDTSSITNEDSTDKTSAVTSDEVSASNESNNDEIDFFSDKDVIVDNVRYRTYCNSRFGFCIDYPADFTVKEAPENGDGRSFVNKNAELFASAAWGFMWYEDIKEAFEASKERKHTVTYEQIKSNWFVLSGYNEDGRVYYTKTMIIKKNNLEFDEEGDVEITATLIYDVSEKSYYEKIIPRIFNSIK